MRGGEQKQGYTIVEVMIFLAISGVMFVMAAGFISGKQARSEFRQGMNDINGQMKQIINDVSNGFYPSTAGFKCAANDTGAPYFPTGSLEEGTNQGCTFIGKTLQFGLNGTSGAGFNTYSIVGRQFQPGATASTSALPPTSFAEASPVAADSGSHDLTERAALKWGLEVTQITDTGHGNIGAFGFFAGFATTTANNLDSGAAAPVAVAFLNSSLNQTPTTWTSDLTDPSKIDTNPQIVMCFHGGANQYGTLTIGTNNGNQGQKLATRIQISSGVPVTGSGCPV